MDGSVAALAVATLNKRDRVPTGHQTRISAARQDVAGVAQAEHHGGAAGFGLQPAATDGRFQLHPQHLFLRQFPGDRGDQATSSPA